jgi:hypothetical protein
MPIKLISTSLRLDPLMRDDAEAAFEQLQEFAQRHSRQSLFNRVLNMGRALSNKSSRLWDLAGDSA